MNTRDLDRLFNSAVRKETKRGKNSIDRQQEDAIAQFYDDNVREWAGGEQHDFAWTVRNLLKEFVRSTCDLMREIEAHDKTRGQLAEAKAQLRQSQREFKKLQAVLARERKAAARRSR